MLEDADAERCNESASISGNQKFNVSLFFSLVINVLKFFGTGVINFIGFSFGIP